jgi:hypothetical protein
MIETKGMSIENRFAPPEVRSGLKSIENEAGDDADRNSSANVLHVLALHCKTK